MILLLVSERARHRHDLRDLLQRRGRVEVADSLPLASDLHRHTKYDVTVVSDDWPVETVISWCSQLRQQGYEQGLIVLIPAEHQAEGAKLLDAGADDVLTQPITPYEFLARVMALTRRSHHQYQPAVLEAGLLKIDLVHRTATYQETLIKLRRKEFLLLAYFMQHQYHVMSKTRIFKQIWGDDSPSSDHTVEVHIQALRRKIDQRFGQQFIVTVYGFGYKFVCPQS